MTTAIWYDGANRPIRSAQFGTNAAGFQSGGSVPTISQSAPPSANPGDSSRLVTETHYNVRGLVDTVVDPAGRMTQFRYDDMNRRIAVIENADPAHPVFLTWNFEESASFGGFPTMRWQMPNKDHGLDFEHPDRNRVTSFVFDGLGNVVRQAAYFIERDVVLEDPPIYEDALRMQETAYLYDASRLLTGSSIASNDLLAEIHYPDSVPEGLGGPSITAPRPVRFGYNRQGEVIEMRDPNDTTHTYTRDALGRMTLDKATVSPHVVGFAVDDRINAIETEFDLLGRMKNVRSYTDHGGGGQAVVSAVQLGYDDLWQITSVKQRHDGEVNGGTAEVTYAYAIEPWNSGNFSRQTALGYPDGWTLSTTYGTSTSIDNRIHRPVSLRDVGANATYVTYSYLGAGTPVIINYSVRACT